MEVSMADEPPKLSEQELAHRQSVLDMFWQAKRDEEDYRRKQAQARSCHRGPNDADWDLIKWPW